MTKSTLDILKEAISEASNITVDDLETALALLADFPSNGRSTDHHAVHFALALGLVEEQIVSEPCRACGRPVQSYSFFKKTRAGKMLLAALAKVGGGA